MSLAFIDPEHGLMTWRGVGRVEGVLMRWHPRNGNGQESLLLRAGVVGSQLPPLQANVIPVSHEDTLFFATDGIRGGFAETITPFEHPHRAAGQILEKNRRRKDDALTFGVRFKG